MPKFLEFQVDGGHAGGHDGGYNGGHDGDLHDGHDGDRDGDRDSDHDGGHDDDSGGDGMRWCSSCTMEQSPEICLTRFSVKSKFVFFDPRRQQKYILSELSLNNTLATANAVCVPRHHLHP